MCNINDKDVYLSKMRRTFLDKSWFMSIIPSEITTIIDFGCSDGSFIEYLSKDFPEYTYIGIENNENFYNINISKGIPCYKSLEELKKTLYIDQDSTLLILNSVVHEIYSYWNMEEFWSQVKSVNPKYIAFRDMYARNCGVYGSRTEEELEKICNTSFMRDHYKDFIKENGPINDGYTAVHFLLKYFYNENWNREVKENYIPFHYRDLHKMIRDSGYNVTFERFYSLQFLKNKWHEDFNCNVNPHLKTFIDGITTHLKLFLIRGFDY